MNQFPLKKFLKKLLIASIPVLLIVGIYVCADPFKVLYRYDYASFHDFDPRVNSLNKDYISTELFSKGYPKCKFDSYIFGSSRSGVYMGSDWKKHINSTAFFHYDSYYESLYGVERKVAFLSKKGVKIKNALFVIDHELLSEINNSGNPLSRKHPLLSGENILSFQLFMFKSFLQLDYLTTRLRLYMADSKVKNRSAELMQEQSSCEIAANEDRWYEMEKKIAKNPDSFYNARIFYRREPGQHFTPPILKQAHIVMLTNIKKILEANATNYKIVISPLYDQKKLNPADLIRLQAIFGKDKVTDLSGVNEITENVRNYYEESHYRIPVAREIMDKYIYAK